LNEYSISKAFVLPEPSGLGLLRYSKAVNRRGFAPQIIHREDNWGGVGTSFAVTSDELVLEWEAVDLAADHAEALAAAMDRAAWGQVVRECPVPELGQ
jgi:hypothetical protein